MRLTAPAPRTNAAPARRTTTVPALGISTAPAPRTTTLASHGPAWLLAIVAFAVTALLFLAQPPRLALAYEALDVQQGGRIHGRIVFHGEAPRPEPVTVSKDAHVCGKQIPDESLVVGEGSGVAQAVVYLADIQAGRPVDTAVEGVLDNHRCRFEPHVQALSVGQVLVISNSDPILHNTHSYVLEGTQGNRFNLALPRQGQKIRRPLRLPGIHQVRCDAGHTWMNAYFLVFEHPYHTVTGADGEFALDGIPPGEYTLSVWHEKLGKTSRSVRVGPGADVVLPDLVLTLKK